MKDMATGMAAALEADLPGALSASTGIHRSHRLPTRGESVTGHPEYIFVEMSVRGGSNPSAARPILTLLGEALDLSSTMAAPRCDA